MRLKPSDTPKKQTLLKLFIFPTIVGIIISIFSMGMESISLNVIEACIFAGVEFMFVIAVIMKFTFTGPIRGKALAVLYGAAGMSAGITWRAFARPSWSVVIAAATGCILALAWVYTEGGHIEI